MKSEDGSFSFTIPGTPIPKKRPRFSRRHGKVFTYDEQSRESNIVKIQMLQQLSDQGFIKLLDEAVYLSISFHTAIPKSYSRKKAIECLGKPDQRRPDLDNYIKFYLDLMNGLIYRDDSIITEIRSSKFYSEHPRTEIVLRTYNFDRAEYHMPPNCS